MHDDFDYTQEPWQAFMCGIHRLIAASNAKSFPWKFQKFRNGTKNGDPLRQYANGKTGRALLQNLKPTSLAYGDKVIELVYLSLSNFKKAGLPAYEIKYTDGQYTVQTNPHMNPEGAEYVLVKNQLTSEQITFLAKKLIGVVQQSRKGSLGAYGACTKVRRQHVLLAPGQNQMPLNSWKQIIEAANQMEPGLEVKGQGQKSRLSPRTLLHPNNQPAEVLQLTYAKSPIRRIVFEHFNGEFRVTVFDGETPRASQRVNPAKFTPSIIEEMFNSLK